MVGWDEQTGTHLLMSVPGVEEDTPWEQYLQVGHKYAHERLWREAGNSTIRGWGGRIIYKSCSKMFSVVGSSFATAAAVR